ncbi:MAG: endolytic transglycosylase MltG [Candidatus Aminicenantes bacterium]|nr:endolytic transglycosylase MltG [Candidatus Aminicenantes bacterium]
MRGLRTSIKAALWTAQLLILGGWVWLFLESRAPRPSPRPAGPAVFEIERGWTVRTVADELKSRGLIRKTTPFVLFYEFFHAPRSLKAGEYELPAGARTREILGLFVGGRIRLHPLTVPEGLTGAETAEVFAAAGFETREAFLSAFAATETVALLDPRAADLEGYLFPETYHFSKGTTAAEAVERMTSQFKSVFSPAWRRRAAELSLDVREVVTLASLIEKETASPEEKPLVSAVFHNRLKLGMKLDCDPTVIYALKKLGPWNGRLRTKDLKLDSPYNTYLYPGLPPGPICNPGRASLEAALHPSEADYLYFVSRNDGTHVFSRTLREHATAVLQYQR